MVVLGQQDGGEEGRMRRVWEQAKVKLQETYLFLNLVS